MRRGTQSRVVVNTSTLKATRNSRPPYAASWSIEGLTLASLTTGHQRRLRGRFTAAANLGRDAFPSSSASKAVFG
jgi:hypothetical protein